MDTFQQPKITGYRQLSEAEVALMNEGKPNGRPLVRRCDWERQAQNGKPARFTKRAGSGFAAVRSRVRVLQKRC